MVFNFIWFLNAEKLSCIPFGNVIYFLRNIFFTFYFMIGKPNWFQRRKYGGWGIFPKTWQGWVYIAGAIAIFALIQYFPLGDAQATGNGQIRIIATFIFAAIFVLDIIHIMVRLPMDERDRIHEAIAERNALWAIVTALAVGMVWQAATSAITKNIQIDPILIAALVVGVLAKAATNIYLDKKN
jgi:hypothetical protein